MLMATPETIWLPRWEIAAKPWTRASAVEARMPAARPAQAEPVACAAGGGREGGDQHLALQPDVDDAGALGPESGKAGGEQRDREAQGGVEHREEGGGVHAPQASAGTGRGRGARSRATRRRKRPSSAPANRMMMPPITTTMSRVIAGCSKASSAPPW